MKMKEHNTTTTERERQIEIVSQSEWVREERTKRKLCWLTNHSLASLIGRRKTAENYCKKTCSNVRSWNSAGKTSFSLRFSLDWYQRHLQVIDAYRYLCSRARARGSGLTEFHRVECVRVETIQCRSVWKTNLKAEREKKERAIAGWNSSGASRRCSMLFSDANAEKTNEVFG